MKVLVAYGSKRGGTEGLAHMIGEAFEARGIDADVADAAEVRVVDADEVVVAGALYAARWHRHARRFVHRHATVLRTKPVWLVSSGPLDDSAAVGEVLPVGQVRREMARVAARGHETFGGRLCSDAKGFPASAMAKKLSGDWRDAEHVDRWVEVVAGELLAGSSNRGGATAA